MSVKSPAAGAAEGTLTPAPESRVETLVADWTDELASARADTWEPNDPTDPIVCDCLQVRLGTLEACVRRGSDTAEALARDTGATTVCGGCAPRVAELVGAPSGHLTQIKEMRELLPEVRSFRFDAPPAAAVGASYPGQHVIVSAFIDDEWVSRPYTLSSPAGHETQEITVKLEPGGILSSWLFAQSAADLPWVRITPPQGRFLVDLTRREPIVLLVAGIGITPAITAARTFARENGHLVHIDYSAREPAGFAFEDEIRELAIWCDRITTRFRITARGERLTEEEVRRLRWRFPRGRFYICGPGRYQTAVREYLTAAGVEGDRIHVEVFTPARALPADPSAAPRAKEPQPKVKRFPNAGSQALGLVLLILYLAQGIFGWEWTWLFALQEQEAYRRWSGAALLGFVGMQWVLPVLRMGVDFKAIRLAYRWHRWAGAISPVLFYAHASWLGAGYLAALASVYLASLGVGALDKTIIPNLALRDRYVRPWLVVHVALACLMVGLTLFHVFVVFAYR